MKKIFSALILILIFIGITLSVLNFTTRAYASSAATYGTTTQITNLFDH